MKLKPEAQYDVFVSYSKPDEHTVTTLAEALRGSGLRVWLDIWSLIPGEPWQRSIEEAMTRTRSIAVCVGASGVGTWQQAEIQSLLHSTLSDQLGPRVIPVILPGADPQSLPVFLRTVVWVDMRKGFSDEIALGRLMSAIEGSRERGEIAQEQELGDHLRLAADLDGAVMHYERALRIARATYGGSHPLIAELLTRLAGVQRDMGNHSGALMYLQEALEIQSAIYGGDSERLSTTLNNLGSALRDQGRLEEAMVCLQRALAIDERALGSGNPTVANRLNNLGSVLRDQGRLQEAAAYFERALAIDEKALGSDNPTVAIRLSNLGSVLRDQGRLEEAAIYFQRALAIDERVHGSDHPTVANRLNNLGSVLRDQGRLEEAAAYFQRALAIDEKALGPNHPSSATILNNLAGVYAQSKTGDHDANLRESVHLLERAHAIFQRLGSAFETGQTLSNLAVAYSRLRGGDRHENTQRALSYCDDALRVLRQLGAGSDQGTVVRELQRTRQELVARLPEPRSRPLRSGVGDAAVGCGLAAPDEKQRQQAFSELYESYRKRLLAFVRTRAHSESEAEDIAQAVWARIWTNPPSYDPNKGPFWPFLAKAALGQSIDHYRSASRRADIKRSSDLLHRLAQYHGLDLGLEDERESAPEVADVTSSPADRAIHLEQAYSLLKRAFAVSGMPHQLISFGFLKLVEWTPRELVSEQSDTPLQELLEELVLAIAQASELSDDQVQSVFLDIRSAMTHLVRDMAPGPHEHFPSHLLERVIGGTVLRQYFVGDPERCVTSWAYNVTRRIIQSFRREQREFLEKEL